MELFSALNQMGETLSRATEALAEEKEQNETRQVLIEEQNKELNRLKDEQLEFARAAFELKRIKNPQTTLMLKCEERLLLEEKKNVAALWGEISKLKNK